MTSGSGRSDVDCAAARRPSAANSAATTNRRARIDRTIISNLRRAGLKSRPYEPLRPRTFDTTSLWNHEPADPRTFTSCTCRTLRTFRTCRTCSLRHHEVDDHGPFLWRQIADGFGFIHVHQRLGEP